MMKAIPVTPRVAATRSSLELPEIRLDERAERHHGRPGRRGVEERLVARNQNGVWPGGRRTPESVETLGPTGKGLRAALQRQAERQLIALGRSLARSGAIGPGEKGTG